MLLDRLRFGPDIGSPDSPVTQVSPGESPYIETDHPERLASYVSRASETAGESVAAWHDGPPRVVIEARFRHPGLIVLPLSASTYYFAGYTYFLAAVYALFGHHPADGARFTWRLCRTS